MTGYGNLQQGRGLYRGADATKYRTIGPREVRGFPHEEIDINRPSHSNAHSHDPWIMLPLVKLPCTSHGDKQHG
jgi:hypothetical protein